MAHVFAGPFQKAGGIRQRRAVEESDVDVRTEDADIGERSILYARGRVAVVHELQDVIAACTHLRKPLARYRAERLGLAIEPGVDGGIAPDRSRESQDGVQGYFQRG